MGRISNVGKYLVVNLKINLSAPSEYSGVYDSRIEDISSDGMFISVPTNKGSAMPVRPGMKVEGSFISSGGRFLFTTTVKRRAFKNIPLLELEKPTFLEQRELREFFRIDISRRIVVYSLIRDEKSGALVRDKEFEVTCVDISGGGARLVSENPMDDISDIEADFTGLFPGLNSIFAVVVRYNQNQSGKYDVGIRFTSLRDADRDKIVKFVFKRQIERRALA